MSQKPATSQPDRRTGVPIGSVSPKTRLALAVLTLVALCGCAPIYGANFDYPDEPAVPSTVKVLVDDKGSDDDDPMRARVRVIDISNSATVDLLDFYRATYGSANGWEQVKVDRRYQELCLVRHSDKDYSEFVEVFPYEGSRVTMKRSRHLVLISRLEHLEPGDDKKSCGMASAWIPSDLL